MKTTFAALAFFLTSAISSALDIPDDDIPLFMVADVLYAPGYLETLTEQELKGDFSRKYFEGHKGVLREVFAKDVGNMNSETRFAYKDPRNVSGGGDYLTAGYNGHLYDVTKIPAIEQDKWFLDAMGIWVDIKCSDPPIKHVDLPHPEWPGVAEVYFQSGMIDTSFRQADIQVIGFKDKTEMPFFDGPEGRFILGVNLRIVHFDENGPTDIDGDGKLDIAVNEVYFNSRFEWTADEELEGTRDPVSGRRRKDFPTVAIHELGHAFSVDHFGTLAVVDGEIVATPESIMNAAYSGAKRELSGREKGAFCSVWSDFGKGPN